MNDNEAEQRREELIVRMGRAISQINGVYAKAEKLMGLNPYVSKVLLRSLVRKRGSRRARYAMPTRCPSRRSTTS